MMGMNSTPAAAARITGARNAKLGGPSFDITDEDRTLIQKIVHRAEEAGITQKADRVTHLMDLTACHANGCPLDLERMLTWSREFDLAHDIFGINRHLDRDTGALTRCFLPRFHAKDA